VAEFDPLTISDEELKQLAPADRAKVYKARAAARAGGGAPAPAAAAPSASAPTAGAPAAPAPTPEPTVEPVAEVKAEAEPAPAPAAAPSGETKPAPAAAPSGETKPAPAPPPKEEPKEPEKPKVPDFVQTVLDTVADSTWQWRHGYAEIEVPSDKLLESARTLKEDGFDYLSFVTEVDWKDRFELVYHLYAYDFRKQPLGVILRTKLPREGMPAVASLTAVWPGAEFMEREAFEMMGIRFIGHPDLRKILLPDDFRGFPMRRDYETDFEYITVKQLVRETD
jgi:NADH-quinone oxidoreductase subunit C